LSRLLSRDIDWCMSVLRYCNLRLLGIRLLGAQPVATDHRALEHLYRERDLVVPADIGGVNPR
jgi:hypothetical protein